MKPWLAACIWKQWQQTTKRGQSELWPKKLSILLVVWMFLCVRVVQAERRLVWLNAACQASAADRAYLNRRSTVCSCSLVRSSLTVPLFPLALPPFPYSVQTPVNICVSSQSNSFLPTFLGEFKPLSSDIYSTVLCKSLESPLSCHFFFWRWSWGVVLRASRSSFNVFFWTFSAFLPIFSPVLTIFHGIV